MQLKSILFTIALVCAQMAASASTLTNENETSKVLSIFWCGFSGTFCGQSADDDIYPEATHVILAFANTDISNGMVTVDTMPTDLISKWHKDGKKVIISIGGQNGHWEPLFNNPKNFISSLVDIVKQHNLDGVDLDIEGYITTPHIVSKTIKSLRIALDKAHKGLQIIISPENVTVYPDPSVPVPDENTATSWNYLVPIINESIDSIDYIQPQFYNNGYLNATPASSDFIIRNYLGWLNKDPNYTIPNFAGVPEEKLIIGLLASQSAGISSFYTPPEAISGAYETLTKAGYRIKGFMLWDSNWDKLNNFEISKTAATLNKRT